MKKSLLSLPLLLLLPLGEAAADDGSLGFSASGGVVVADPLEVLGTTWTVVPRLDYWINPTLALELEVGYGNGQTSVGIPETFGFTSVTPRLTATGRVFPDEPFNLLLSMGAGAWYKKVNDEGRLGLPVGDKADLDFLAHAGPGVLLPFGGSGVALRSDVRFLLNVGSTIEESFQNRGDWFVSWEWTAGLAFGVPAKRDADEDGIVDADDRCVEEAEDLDQFEDADGCPDPDNDGDQVADAEDQCDADKEDVDSFEDTDGCPELDNDKDGIADGEDVCMNEAGAASAKGCPDADGDAIVDATDECEDEAGPDKSFGCPDKDADRVPDHRDACPEEAAHEKINPLKSDGCPGRVFISDNALVITETIQFDTGKATIKKASDALLADIANTLKKYPGIKQLQIEGHTDDAGDDAKNQKLSEDRAAAVQTWLVSKGGIEATRLTAKGVGEAEPIADNATDEGRTVNRRVEFEILAQDMSPGFKRRMREQGVPKAEEKPAEAPAAEEPKALERPADAPKAEEGATGTDAAAPKAEDKPADDKK